ncbi:TPA: pyridoxal phosphate-dependent aminotransferase [Candidatus Woesearchaeota archaeon]|nr:pyridoxal phosphate-dependent aminotransferase [Candidatus Woesearchaeota archaeon]
MAAAKVEGKDKAKGLEDRLEKAGEIPQFSVPRDELKRLIKELDPFRLMQTLKEYAAYCSAKTGVPVVDLSRGSPSYEHSQPSVEGDEIFGYMFLAASYLSSDKAALIEFKKTKSPATLERILKRVTREHGLGEQFIQRASRNLSAVMDHLAGVPSHDDNDKRKFKVKLYNEMLQYIRGIPYGPIQGLDVAKIYMKSILDDHDRSLDDKVKPNGKGINYNDILITQGVSQGIDTFFKSDHFEDGDIVFIITPFYPPYQLLTGHKNLQIIPIPSDPKGKLHLDTITELKKTISKWRQKDKDRIKSCIMIDPSNPSGWVLSKKEKKALAGLKDVAPNLIFCEDMVYKGYGRNRFVFMRDAAPGTPVITYYSGSKVEKRAGTRVGALYASKEAQDILRRNGILDKVIGPHKTAAEYLAQLKGGPAYHTNQSSTLAQILVALGGTFDVMNGHVEGFSHELAKTRRRLFKLFKMSAKERLDGSNYYFWLNVYSFVQRDLLKEKHDSKKYILEHLDVPEVILQAIEKDSTVLFSGSSFYPKSQMPNELHQSGYVELYDSKQNGHPETYIRGALPNTDPESFIKAYKNFRQVIREHVDQLRKEYARLKPSKRAA